ncbi:hypothetical protein [Micromonospora chalcea]|uniref:hypothetical protein n=1 Tax=Micromonospora chalcea TaxID=1874 RepID=UPI0004C2E38E|nr:hypothetical protein [Micromonospora purpureochromogenes]
MSDPTQPAPPEQTGEATMPNSPTAANRPAGARPLVAGGVVLALAISGVVLAGALTEDDEPQPVTTVTAAQHSAAPASASPSAVPTTAAPTTASPTPAAPATTEPPAPSPTPKPKVVKGRGDDVVRIPDLTDLAVVKFTCQCSSNTVLTSDGDGLLVNEIGSYTGKRWINLEDGSLTTQFEIEASGSWTLTIGTVAQLATKSETGKASGKGDDVLLLGGDATAVRITHRRGSSNFAVHAYSLDDGEGGLLVNEIGAYSGVRPLTTPALVQITADGNWTVAPA